MILQENIKISQVKENYKMKKQKKKKKITNDLSKGRTYKIK